MEYMKGTSEEEKEEEGTIHHQVHRPIHDYSCNTTNTISEQGHNNKGIISFLFGDRHEWSNECITGHMVITIIIHIMYIIIIMVIRSSYQ